MADEEEKPSSCGVVTWNFWKMHWPGIMTVLIPIVLLPIFLLNNTPPWRCMYVVSVMALYWVLEVLPLGITALIPMVLFPVMGILGSKETSLCYMKDTNMMFIGGLVIAIAIEYSNLHRRIAVNVIMGIGCSPRRLHLGLCGITMFISMWISNTAATAMMCPIVEAILHELEGENILKVFDNQEVNSPDFDLGSAKPSKVTACIYLSIAYSASVGGIGTIIGTGTNLTMKGIYDSRYPDATETIDFTSWLVLGIPCMIACEILVILWMQLLYLGMFRPKSKAAQTATVGKEGVAVARNVMKQKRQELGPMTFHEIMVLILFLMSVVLWLFRKPEFMPGWGKAVSKTTDISDSAVAIMTTILFFMIPMNPSFIHSCNRDPAKRPTERATGLLTWKVVHLKMPWGLVLLLGGGFALADGSKASGMSAMMGKFLSSMATLHKLLVLVIILLFITFLTQIFSSNVAVCNIVLPICMEMSSASGWYPMELALPATIACSFAFCLPSSTPPNAIVADPINLPNSEMIKAGAGAAFLCILVTIPILLPLQSLVFPTNTFPAWAI